MTLEYSNDRAGARGLFLWGFVFGLLVDLAANVLSYLPTRHAYYTDGYEIIGFPFKFRSMGGFRYSYSFSYGWLLVDVVFAIVVGCVAGAGWVWWRSGRANRV